jgi:3',5'-cyclic AMP phosphodiesterase CpdA
MYNPTGLTDRSSLFVRVAVASDLHAFDRGTDTTDPSHLDVSTREDILEQHPISGLLDLISKFGLTADMLLCPGDLADKANPGPLKYAWRKLHEIGESLSAKIVAATAGNHDVDSRFAYNDYDAKGMLQSLSPGFPSSDMVRSDFYWSRNFAVEVGDDHRLVLLNTSAYHGYSPPNRPPEYEHGRVASATLSALERHLGALEEKPVNMLLCHHHPTPLTEFGDDREYMANGDRLLELLGSGKYGSWMVIHGHRHVPKLQYAQGSSTSPVIFSAGSLSATIFPRARRRASNQFYIVEFPKVDLSLNVTLPGRILAWDWAHGIGWTPAGADSGLPAISGFGHRGGTGPLAHRIASLIPDDAGWAKWSDVEASVPEVMFLTPSDMQGLRAELQRRGLGVTESHPGVPAQVGRSS